jgi:hypothetical protein
MGRPSLSSKTDPYFRRYRHGMEISPARLACTAPATGRFGETCEHARTHGLSPDPQAFVARFIANGTHAPKASVPEHGAESPDVLRRVA